MSLHQYIMSKTQHIARSESTWPITYLLIAFPLQKDAVLKLLRWGNRYRRLFPLQLRALEAHPSWANFAAAVIAGDRGSKEHAVANRDFKVWLQVSSMYRSAKPNI